MDDAALTNANNKYNWEDLFASYQDYLNARQKQIDSGINDYCLLDTVLKLNDETRLHSRVIASLLNSKSKHYKKGFFTQLLLQKLPTEFQNLNVDNTIIELEKPTGKLNGHAYTGLIDIFLSDGENYWIIENKLNASDQYKQMEKYIDWARQKLSDEISENQITFVFLTKDRAKPSSKSCGRYLIKKEAKDGISWVYERNESTSLQDTKICRYLNLHYQTNISTWLKDILESLSKNDQMRPLILDYQIALNRYLKKDEAKVNNLIDFISGKNTDKHIAHLDMLQDFELKLPSIKAQWLANFMIQCKQYITEQDLVDKNYEAKTDLFKEVAFSKHESEKWFKNTSMHNLSTNKGKNRGIFIPLNKSIAQKNKINTQAFIGIIYGRQKIHAGLLIHNDNKEFNIQYLEQNNWNVIPNYSWYSKTVDLTQDIWFIGKQGDHSVTLKHLKKICAKLNSACI